MSDYLIHSGKLGMKWGQHKFALYMTPGHNWVYKSSIGHLSKEAQARAISKSGSKGMTFIGDRETRSIIRDPLTGQYEDTATALGNIFSGKSSKEYEDDQYDDFYKRTSNMLLRGMEAAGITSVGLKDRWTVTDDIMRSCNPGNKTVRRDDGTVDTSSSEVGTTNNCTKCTAALELGMRGYPVKAGRCIEGANRGSFMEWFKGAETKVTSYDDGTAAIHSMPDNSSGQIALFMQNGGGHAMHWTKTNGKFEIQDGQSGERYSSTDEFIEKHPWFSKNREMELTRLDNCEPDWDNMNYSSVVEVRNDVGERNGSDWTGYNVSGTQYHTYDDYGHNNVRDKYFSDPIIDDYESFKKNVQSNSKRGKSVEDIQKRYSNVSLDDLWDIIKG